MRPKLASFSASILCYLLLGCNNTPNQKTTDKTPNETAQKTIDLANNIGVYDLLKDPAYREQSKQLDLKCPDLNIPELSGDDHEIASQAWVSLNQMIGQHLMDEGFDWATKEETVKIWHKFYFNKDGTINSYYYNIMDKSIPDDTRDAYGKSVSQIISEHRIAIQRDSAFAQCGKMAFQVL